MRLADLVAGRDPVVTLWGSMRRPQFGGREDRRRECLYNREHALFRRAGVNLRRNLAL